MFTWHVFACLLFLFFLDVSCRRASSTWSLCGSEGDSLLNVTDVFFSHPLPGRGSSWTITVRGWLNSEHNIAELFSPPLRSQFFSAFHNHYCFHGSLCDCMHPFWGFGQGPIHPKLQRELTKMGFGLIGVGFQISLNCVWFLLDHYAVRFAALFLAVIRVNLPKVHRFLFFGCVFFCAVIPTALSNHMDPTILSLTGTLRLKSGGGESKYPLLGKCTIAFTASQGFS